ncbi:hypothetical protein [Modestobacter italicus]|uniref:hypothetical protein n=1 Tax=Modestobacter italicus (strain DSM 44449 / CECT 9708 / BC 501) TaxID=2732864 RepID=UPI001C96578F|nr:hypothetical protein [Modestobacter italicus]
MTGLGVAVSLVGTPLVIASSFGGTTHVLIALGLLTVAAVGLAIGLDRVTGPDDADSTGSFLRGLSVGVLGTGGAALFGVAVLQADLRAVLPDPLLLAAAALPFPVVAGLQWPGVVRRGTTLVLLIGAGASVATWYPDARQGWQDDRVLTEVGTLSRPWVTQVDGFRGQSPQHTGSELIVTPYVPVDGGPTEGFELFRDASTAVQGDPCTARTAPGSTIGETVTSCRQVAPDRWSYTTAYSEVLLSRREAAWVGVTAAPGTPPGLLDAALAPARPMTEDEYDAWLDEVLPGPRPSGTF